MYYLFIFSLLSTIIVFLLKYETKNRESFRNCSEYLDPYGNLTIETHKYIYKMSRITGRLFRKQKGSSNKKYNIIKSKYDKNEKIELNDITGMSIITK